MNKIYVSDNIIKLDDSIKFQNNIITIKSNTSLELNTSHDIIINVESNTSLNLYLINKDEFEINYIFNLSDNSNVSVIKYNECKQKKESLIVNLNGYKANFDLVFKTISCDSQNYKIIVNHNAKETVSNIVNNGVNIKDGNLVFDVSCIIPNNIKCCIANQNNRIVNLTDNKCIINPNLYIEEEDVTASHSAYLGKFSNEEIFYLESRGIDYETSLNLLIKGFLLNKVDYELIQKMITNKINEYWR